MKDLEEAARMALEAISQFIGKELTVGQRYTNEGQQLLDASFTLRQALSNSVEQSAQQRHIAYVCPQCYWTLEEQPAQQQEWRGPVDWEAVAADYAMTIAMMKVEQEDAVLAEREACAKVCENHDLLMNSTFQGVAEAIRARRRTLNDMDT